MLLIFRQLLRKDFPKDMDWADAKLTMKTIPASVVEKMRKLSVVKLGVMWTQNCVRQMKKSANLREA